MPNFKNLLAAAAFSAMTLTGVSSANAAIITVDPGNVGQSINEIAVTVTPGDLGSNNEFHVVFDMMKHVELRSQLNFADILVPSQNSTVPQITGQFYLTDEFHMELSGTRRMFTIFPFPGPPFGVLDPPLDPVIFHDFHIEFDNDPFASGSLAEVPNNIILRFDADVVVGEWAPISEPGALAIFGLGLLGLGLIRRQKRAA